MPESIRSDTGARAAVAAAPRSPRIRGRAAVTVGAWLTEDDVAALTRGVDAWLAPWGGGETVVVSLRQPQPGRTRMVIEYGAPPDYAGAFAAAAAQGAENPTLWDVVLRWSATVPATVDSFTADARASA
jgi:hypothetical protein